MTELLMKGGQMPDGQMPEGVIWRQITGTFPREKIDKGMYARKTFASA